MEQYAYNTLERFYVNYAGGEVEGITFDKKTPICPQDDRETLQQNIVKQFGVADPTQHSSWVSKNALGPVFIYRTERKTESKLYPAMNVVVDGNTYTIGASQPCDEAAIHYFTLGSNGAQVDFINEQPYDSSNSEQKEKVNAAVNKMIDAINSGKSFAVQIQVLFAETSFVAGTFPTVISKDTMKNINFQTNTNSLGQGEEPSI